MSASVASDVAVWTPRLITDADQLLVSADPRRWVEFDASVRNSWWPPGRRSSQAAGELLAGDQGPVDLLIAACHGSGYVREATVRQLADRELPSVLPILALRAADWVRQVREPARALCLRHLERAPSTTCAVLAPVAFAVRDRQFGDWLATELEHRFRQSAPDVLADGLRARDRRTRRVAHRIALATGRLTVEEIVRVALTDDDIAIRRRCGETAIRQARGTADESVARRLLGSRTSAVRADALSELAAAGHLEPSYSALADRSPIVRATAQTMVRRAGDDPAARYRALAAGGVEPSVVAGLGETGTSADVPVLRDCLGHHSARVRAEAVRALRRLGDTAADVLMPVLADPAPRVTRQVVRSLLAGSDALDTARLAELAAPGGSRSVRMAATRLLGASDVWLRVAGALRLVGDPDPAMHRHGLTDLRTWLAEGASTAYSRPDQRTTDDLRALITQAEPMIGADTARVIRFHAGITRPVR